MILRLNENGSKQYESSHFSYMEVVPNMEEFIRVFPFWKVCRRYFSYIHPQLPAKLFFPMAAAMCQALPSFHSDYSKNSLFISVSNDFYEKHISSLLCVSSLLGNSSLLCVYPQFFLFFGELYVPFGFIGNFF